MPRTKIFILPTEKKRFLDWKSSTFHCNTYVFTEQMEISRADWVTNLIDIFAEADFPRIVRKRQTGFVGNLLFKNACNNESLIWFVIKRLFQN